jgi:hypothetical protein
MASSNPLELTKPIGTIIKSRDMKGEDVYYRKTATDTWVDLSSLVPHSSNDGAIKYALIHEQPMTDAERNNYLTNKAVAYNTLKGLVGASGADQSSPRKTALFIDVESAIRKDKLNSAITMGVTATDGTLPGMPDRYKPSSVELFFTHNMGGDPNTGMPGLLADAGYDRRIQKFSGLLGAAAHNTARYLKRHGRMGTKETEEELMKLKSHQEYFIGLSRQLKGADDQAMKTGKAYDHKEFLEHLHDMYLLKSVDKSGDTAFGAGVGWMQLDNKRMIGIVGDKNTTSSVVYNRYADAQRGTALFFAYNSEHETSVLGAKEPLHDARGAQMLMMQQMFPEHGMAFANSLGYMNPSTVKKIGLADKVTQDIFTEMNKGPGSMFMGGMNLESMHNAMNFVHGQKRMSEQHYGMADNAMTIDTTRKLAKTMQLIDDERKGIFDPSYASAMSVEAKTRFAIFREIAAEKMMKDDKLNLYGKAKSDYIDIINRKTTLPSREKGIAKELERNIGYDMNKTFGGMQNAFGGTVGSALAGAFLASGVKWTAMKAQQMFSGDHTKLEAMNHNSFMTMMRRYQMTDFGSAVRFENGVLPSVFRAVGHLFTSIFEKPSSMKVVRSLQSLNQDVKDIGEGKGVLKTLDRRLAKIVAKPIYGAYVAKVRSALKETGSTNVNYDDILADYKKFKEAYRDTIHTGFFGSVTKNTKAYLGAAVAKRGGKRELGKAALRSLGSIFLKDGKLTGVAKLTGLGMAGGLLLGLSHGQYDPNIQIDPYNPNKVRNDPRFKERRHQKLRELLRNARNSDMDGLPDTSQMRMGNRQKITDFGSGWANDLEAIGKLVGSDVRWNQAREDIFSVTSTLSDMHTGQTNLIAHAGEDVAKGKALARRMKESNTTPSLGQAYRNVSGGQWFMGGERGAADRVTTTATPMRSPMESATAKDVSKAHIRGQAERILDMAVAVGRADTQVSAKEMRDMSDQARKVAYGRKLAREVVPTVTPHPDSALPERRIIDITSATVPKGDIYQSGENFKAAMLMPPPSATSERVIVKTAEDVITPGDMGKAAAKYRKQLARSEFGPVTKKVKAFIGGEQPPGQPFVAHTSSPALHEANTRILSYNGTRSPLDSFIYMGTSPAIRGTEGESAIAATITAAGGEAGQTIRVHPPFYRTTPKLAHPYPNQLPARNTKQAHRMAELHSRDQALSIHQTTFSASYSQAHRRHPIGGETSAYDPIPFVPSYR